MIFITVQSDFMQIKRQFESDKASEKFLKEVYKLHEMQRYELSKKISSARTKDKRAALEQNAIVPLRVDIQNTEAAQLNFHHQLK